MEIGAMMSQQVAELQRNVQMSLLDRTLNIESQAAVKMLESLPQQPAAQHPSKGTVVDLSI